MACLGVLFSIDQTTVDLIKQFPSEQERIEYIKEVLEEDYFDNQPQWVYELGKSWDALHRSLTDGELDWINGEFPLNHVVFGGEILSDDNYIIVLKRKEQVTEIAEAVNRVTEDDLRKGYSRILADEYDGVVSEQDFQDTWQWFGNSIEFWQRAASENRSILFTVDQ
jgi:hypothetical protein